MSDKPVMNHFDIHEKIKRTGSIWARLKSAQPHQNGCNYELNTILTDEIEFALYERKGDYFVLVDFFNNYEDACEEAKIIIDKNTNIKSMFTQSHGN